MMAWNFAAKMTKILNFSQKNWIKWLPRIRNCTASNGTPAKQAQIRPIWSFWSAHTTWVSPTWGLNFDRSGQCWSKPDELIECGNVEHCPTVRTPRADLTLMDFFLIVYHASFDKGPEKNIESLKILIEKNSYPWKPFNSIFSEKNLGFMSF